MKDNKSKEVYKKLNWKKLLFLFIVIVFVAYFFILFLQWNFTLYHEQGHLDACKIVNLSCELQSKSFPEYLQMVNYNLLQGRQYFSEMQVVPKNQTEFCNLSVQSQQLIRIAGFRNDLKIMLLIGGILVIEIISFFGLIFFNILKKRKTLYKTIVLFLSLISLTALLLFNEIIQFISYFSKNLGDLFYFPCS